MKTNVSRLLPLVLALMLGLCICETAYAETPPPVLDTGPIQYVNADKQAQKEPEPKKQEPEENFSLDSLTYEEPFASVTPQENLKSFFHAMSYMVYAMLGLLAICTIAALLKSKGKPVKAQKKKTVKRKIVRVNN